jgi:hypothetical protein
MGFRHLRAGTDSPCCKPALLRVEKDAPSLATALIAAPEGITIRSFSRHDHDCLAQREMARRAN